MQSEKAASLQIEVESSGIAAADAGLERLEVQGTQTEKATKRLTDEFRRNSKAGKDLSDSSTNLSYRAGQLSYQLQDVAIQAQNGTSMFTIMAQQGSQVASVFGAGGVIAGGLIAVTAALAGLAFNTQQADKNLEELRNESESLSDSFEISDQGALIYSRRLERIAETAPTVANALYQIEKAQLQLEQTMVQSELNDTLADFDELTGILDQRSGQYFEESKTSAAFLASTLSNLTEEFGGTNREIVAIADSLKAFEESPSKETAIDLADSLTAVKNEAGNSSDKVRTLLGVLGRYIEIGQTLSASNSPFENDVKSIDRLISRLERKAALADDSERQVDVQFATDEGASTEQLRRINEAYDQIEQERSDKAIERLEMQLLSEEEKILESYERRREIILANTEETSEQQNELLRANDERLFESFLGDVDRELKEENKAKKQSLAIEERHSKQIIRQKQSVANAALALANTLAGDNEKVAKVILLTETALNVRRTIQNASAAAVRAVAELGPIAGPPAAAKIKGWGMVEAGIIAANGVLSVAGGGGGGSTPSLGGGSGSSDSIFDTPAPNQSQNSGPEKIINFYGSGLVSSNEVRELIEVINEEAGDRLDVRYVGV